MERYEIAIIGAGASGMMAAITAAQTAKRADKDIKVALLEGNSKAGRKLLATGNGRCNLTNMHVGAGHYHGSQQELIAEILAPYPPERIITAFEELGLYCREDEEGRVYPYNLQAAAVLRVLRAAIEELGVIEKYDLKVSSVKKENGDFIIKAGAVELAAKRLIIATGGKASPKHSCSTNGYEIAQSLGHGVSSCAPALVQVKIKETLTKALKGMRSKARVSLVGLNGSQSEDVFNSVGEEIYSENGEVIFNEDAISGICIFNASTFVAERELTGKIGEKSYDELRFVLDFAPDISSREVLRYLQSVKENHSEMWAINLLSGLLNIKVGEEIIKVLAEQHGFDWRQPIEKLNDEILQAVALAVKAFSLTVAELAPFEGAQVTAGGVPVEEITVFSMESKPTKGLYFGGEILNVNGDCGGYNLHFAWATGMRAGRSAVESL